jgi:hypothetical protein
MEIITYAHRNAFKIIEKNNHMSLLWNEVKKIILAISEDEVIECFETENRKAKSVSEAINKLLKNRLREKKWNHLISIFTDPNYDGSNGVWRVDYIKDNVSLEVAFNHAGNCSWNLIKPVLASELNIVKKAINTSLGIIITATESMKKVGGFDMSVGSYEKYIEYLAPLNNILVTPLLIVGLEAPKTFKIIHSKLENRKIGKVVRVQL